MVPPELFPEGIEDCGVATTTCRSIDFVAPLCVCYASLDIQQSLQSFPRPLLYLVVEEKHIVGSECS
jgi:hypothetical protein